MTMIGSIKRNMKIGHSDKTADNNSVVDSRTKTKSVKFKLTPVYQENNSQHRSFLSDIKSWLFTNQSGNVSTTTEESSSKTVSLDEGANRSKAERLSLIYIKNQQDKLYKLIFRAVNCHIIPLYTKERFFVDKENDKKIQPNSKSVYIEGYTPDLTRFNTTSKNFHLQPGKDDKDSIMSFRKNIGKSRKVEPLKRKKAASVSSTKSNRFKSVIFITVQGVDFKLYPRTMSLDFSKPLNNDLMANSLLNNLGIESAEQKKNKASIVAKCKGDVLKFTFCLEDVNYQHIPDQISRSVQVQDRNIYIRTWSTVSDRIVQVPLPRSNYKYEDPMVNIKRKNDSLKLHNIEPRWLYQTRRNRLMANKQCQQVDPAQKAYEATNGSSVLYEGTGTLNKARDGLMHCVLPPGEEDKYERWVVNSQKEVRVNTNEETTEQYQFNSSILDEVPDWDLVMHYK